MKCNQSGPGFELFKSRSSYISSNSIFHDYTVQIKISLFQAIQLSISTQFSFIQPIDRTLSCPIFEGSFISELMNLNSVFMCQNMIPEILFIAAINQQDYSCQYDETLLDLMPKKL